MNETAVENKITVKNIVSEKIKKHPAGRQIKAASDWLAADKAAKGKDWVVFNYEDYGLQIREVADGARIYEFVSQFTVSFDTEMPGRAYMRKSMLPELINTLSFLKECSPPGLLENWIGSTV